MVLIIRARHFGKQIIANRLQLSEDEPKVETLWLKLYKEYIEAIDAIDNGISQYPTDLKPRYRLRTDVSARVGYLNPAWNQSVDAQTVDVSGYPRLPVHTDGKRAQTNFQQASALVGSEFMNRLDYYANAWLPARDLVIAALNKRKEIDPSGHIILFEQFAPWKVCRQGLVHIQLNTDSVT